MFVCIYLFGLCLLFRRRYNKWVENQRCGVDVIGGRGRRGRSVEFRRRQALNNIEDWNQPDGVGTMTSPNELDSPTPSLTRTVCGTLLIWRKVRDTDDVETEASIAIDAGTPANDPPKTTGAIALKTETNSSHTDHNTHLSAICSQAQGAWSITHSFVHEDLYLKSIIDITNPKTIWKYICKFGSFRDLVQILKKWRGLTTKLSHLITHY